MVLGTERRQSDEGFKASSEETNHDPHDMQAYADGCRFGLWSWWSHGRDCLGPRCAKLWPPFAPEAGQAKATEPLSIITRDDGTKQYAYKGKPLYYYDKDSNAGDTRGDAVGKVWWVAKP